MKSIILIIFISCFSLCVSAQTGINTRTPDASSALDISATDKGVLMPKYTLTSLTNATSPVNGPQAGALIYNVGGAFSKGYYYWDGAKWNRLLVNSEMAQILNLRISGSGTSIIPAGTADNYVSFTTAQTQYINTLGTTNPNGTNITLPAGTYKADIFFDCSSTATTTTGVIADNKHLYVVEAAIVNSSNALLTDLKTVSDIADYGATSSQGYSFSFIFQLPSQQVVKVLLKNGSGATVDSAKVTSQAGLSVNFYRMFE